MVGVFFILNLNFTELLHSETNTGCIALFMMHLDRIYTPLKLNE